ncbi:hypothetical protein HAX54_052712 [Datura stramonium]|uniref:Uncharacterized protein n=1 Tax=Datura stramonium TaxID=4076 RepID=A0ABS8WRM7_DATST|nr:hypothetical protein [Datura stramonium]
MFGVKSVPRRRIGVLKNVPWNNGSKLKFIRMQSSRHSQYWPATKRSWRDGLHATPRSLRKLLDRPCVGDDVGGDAIDQILDSPRCSGTSFSHSCFAFLSNNWGQCFDLSVGSEMGNFSICW